jgi:hypothetical protein
MTLPAGTYRFALADPESGRRTIKVSDKDGTKTFGMFLSISNQRMTPTDKPVVMFKEAAAGAPPAVQVWFYPGESYGYEFAYPHDQALKIAKATHQPVLTQTGNEVARIDENDRPVSADAELKESSEPRTPVATDTQATGRTQTTTAAPAPAPTRTAATTAEPTTAPASGQLRQADTAVGTTGSAPAAPAAKPARTHLPRTASTLPLLALLSTLALSAGIGVGLARQRAR